MFPRAVKVCKLLVFLINITATFYDAYSIRAACFTSIHFLVLIKPMRKVLMLPSFDSRKLRLKRLSGHRADEYGSNPGTKETWLQSPFLTSSNTASLPRTETTNISL